MRCGPVRRAVIFGLWLAATTWAAPGPSAAGAAVYLMVPQEPDTPAPLTAWDTVGTYDTAAECRRALELHRHAGDATVESIAAGADADSPSPFTGTPRRVARR